MNQWNKTTLGEICAAGGGSIQTGPFGSQLHASDYVSVGIPVVMPQNIGDNQIVETGIARISGDDSARLSKHQLEVNDIVYSRRGDVERRAIVRPEQQGWMCGTGCLKVSLGEDPVVDPLFLSYFLGTSESREWLVRHAVGATMLNINTKILSAIPLDLPPLPHQRAIAEVLGALDDKIAANTKLAESIPDLLHSMFRTIVNYGEPQVPFGDLATVTKGVSYKSAHLEPDATALVTLKSFVRTGGYSPRGLKEYSGPYKSDQVISPGELVVAQTDLTQAAEVVGRAVRVPNSSRHTCLVASLDLAIVRPVKDIPAEFLLGVMSAGPFREHCKANTSGTTVLHLRRNAIESFLVPLVDSVTQHRYSAIARPLLDTIDSLEAESTRLAELRDALLPQLMSGNLRVKDAEEVASTAI